MRQVIFMCAILLGACGHMNAGQLAICTTKAAARCLCEQVLPANVCANPQIAAEFELRAKLAQRQGRAAAMGVMMDSLED